MMAELLLWALKLTITTMILAIGMGSSFADLTYLWRRPTMLIRSLLAMYVLVPFAAWALVTLLPLTPGAKVVLLVLAVSAGAPLLPRRLIAMGNSAFIFSLVVTSSLLAIIAVPLWISILARYFGITLAMSWLQISAVIAKSLLLPLVIGMVFRALWPQLCSNIAETILKITGLLLTILAITLLFANWDFFLQVRWQGMAALLCLLLTALGIGHLMGGPDPDDRTALAVACATRHVGIAITVAITFPGTRTSVLLAAYIVVSLLVSLPYLRWRQHTAHRCQCRRVNCDA